MHRRQNRPALGGRRDGNVTGFQFDAGHQEPQRAIMTMIDEAMIT